MPSPRAKVRSMRERQPIVPQKRGQTERSMAPVPPISATEEDPTQLFKAEIPPIAEEAVILPDVTDEEFAAELASAEDADESVLGKPDAASQKELAQTSRSTVEGAPNPSEQQVQKALAAVSAKTEQRGGSRFKRFAALAAAVGALAMAAWGYLEHKSNPDQEPARDESSDMSSDKSAVSTPAVRQEASRSEIAPVAPQAPATRFAVMSIHAGEGSSQALKHLGLDNAHIQQALDLQIQVGNQTVSVRDTLVTAKPDQLSLIADLDNGTVTGVHYSVDGKQLSAQELANYLKVSGNTKVEQVKTGRVAAGEGSGLGYQASSGSLGDLGPVHIASFNSGADEVATSGPVEDSYRLHNCLLDHQIKEAEALAKAQSMTAGDSTEAETTQIQERRQISPDSETERMPQRGDLAPQSSPSMGGGKAETSRMPIDSARLEKIATAAEDDEPTVVMTERLPREAAPVEPISDYPTQMAALDALLDAENGQLVEIASNHLEFRNQDGHYEVRYKGSNTFDELTPTLLSNLQHVAHLDFEHPIRTMALTPTEYASALPDGHPYKESIRTKFQDQIANYPNDQYLRTQAEESLRILNAGSSTEFASRSTQ